MAEKRPFALPAVGISSLLVIFAVLCLTTFAMLSLSTAQAHERLSKNHAAAVKGYYAAECAAEKILARLRSGEIPAGVTEYSGIYSYTCAISETQALAVEVAVNGTDYTILRWQTLSTAYWQADDSLPVWNVE